MSTELLAKIAAQARQAPLSSWREACVVKLLHHSAARLTAGDWQEAITAAQRAYTRGFETSQRKNAGKFLTTLHHLAKGRLDVINQHNARNEQQKESLRQEIIQRKESQDVPTERRDGAVSLADVQAGERADLRAEDSGQHLGESEGHRGHRRSSANVPRPLATPSRRDKEPLAVPSAHTRQAAPKPTATTEESAPGERVALPQDPSADQQCIKQVEPNAQRRSDLTALYWSAIVDRDPEEILRVTALCKKEGLVSLRATTEEHLSRELEDGPRVARQIAMRGWEER